MDIRHIDLANNSIISNKRPPSTNNLNNDCSIKKLKSEDSNEVSKNKEVSIESPLSQDDHMEQLAKIVPDVVNVLNDLGRSDDFGSVLKAIGNGQIKDNIALHLLLDIGQYLRHDSSKHMRYSKTTIDFWTLVQKIIHGKGMRILEGDDSKFKYVWISLIYINDYQYYKSL